MARARKFRRAPEPLESDIQAAVCEHWQKLGRPMTLVAAIPNANAFGQPGLTPGMPDLIVMGPDVPNRIAFIELKRRPRGGKRAYTKTEEAQAEFALLCAELGLHCLTVCGRDEPIEHLEKWGVVREQRYPLELAWP